MAVTSGSVPAVSAAPTGTTAPATGGVPVIIARTERKGESAPTAAIAPQVVVRQPVKIMLDGRVIAETVIEFIEDMQVRRVVPA